MGANSCGKRSTIFGAKKKNVLSESGPEWIKNKEPALELFFKRTDLHARLLIYGTVLVI